MSVAPPSRLATYSMTMLITRSLELATDVWRLHSSHLVGRASTIAHPGDPTLGGPGSEGYYWLSGNSAQTCQNHLCAPLQRPTSKLVRRHAAEPDGTV